jgi:hypothetical protein
MMKQTVLAAAVVVACALGTVPLWAYAEYPSVEKQMKLDEGMTMEQVQALLGDPESTDHAVCGAGVGQPWQCRTWSYGQPGHRFQVVFRKDAAGWVVNSWSS